MATTIPIQTGIGGKLEHVRATEGLRVKKGDLLFAFDSGDLKEKLSANTQEIQNLEQQERLLDRRVGILRQLSQEGATAIVEVEDKLIQLAYTRSLLSQKKSENALLKEQLKKTTVLASDDGQVINIKAKSLNQIFSAGEVLGELVPSERRWTIEAKIRLADIEGLKPKMPAEIVFYTLPAKATPYVDGYLDVIATDLTRDMPEAEPYYKVYITIPEDFNKQLGIEPAIGMPVSILLKGGSRTILSYLIEPLKNILRRSMKEY
jgi:multidrug resistance efflux pump